MTIQAKDTLSLLQKGELLHLADTFKIKLPNRKDEAEVVEALLEAKGVTPAKLLESLPRARLKELCRERGLDDGGREKRRIAAQLLGAEGIFSSPLAQAAPAQTDLGFEETAPRPPARPSYKPHSSKRGRGGGARPAETTNGAQNGAILGFEDRLWESADLLRNNMDPSEYKHVVLGLIFLKYISDAFEERRHQLTLGVAEPTSEYFVEKPGDREAELAELLEDRDEYAAESLFWVPREARWSYIRAKAKLPEIGKIVDDAMDAIERENPKLRGVLPKVYALPSLDKQALGKLIDVISGIGLGGEEHKAKDTLGRVYEYFLAKFAGKEGKGGGEFFTPTSVVRVLVEMLEPYKGRVYDPCCGSGGMFVQSLKFIEAHNGQRDQVAIYGQESNYTTWRLARMNLAIRGVEANLGPKHADSFREDLHPDLRADFVLANPPFNVSEWFGEALADDVRWRFGAPPKGNANFAWVQHFVHHLSPKGFAGFVLANGSMSSMQSGEGEIRQNLVEADLVDCVVALPGGLFYSTGIPACLWFLAKRKQGGKFRDRRGETLFIDARKLGRLEDRVRSKFQQGDTLLARITPCLENGKTALVDFLRPGETSFGSTEFIVMRPRDEISSEWVYCLARSRDFREHAISNMTGSSGRQRVPVDCFQHFKIAEPPSRNLIDFKRATSLLFRRIKLNSNESKTLADLRDTLLPKLISGEIRVPEAEEAVEEVV